MARATNRGSWTSHYTPTYTSSWNKTNNVSRFRNTNTSPLGRSLVYNGYPTAAANYNIENAYKNDDIGGGGKKTGGVKANAGYESLLAMLKAQGLLGDRNSAAQAAYDKGVGALNEAYGAYMAALAENLASTKDTLRDSYDRSKDSIMSDSKNSLKQAYINKMSQEKNLNQQLSAQGLSGGATETTRASMSNNYGNARNEINRTTNNNLSELEGQYNENLASALQAYNSAVANAQLQKAQQMIELENMLANNQMQAMDDYYAAFGDNGDYSAALKLALKGMNGLEFTPTEVSNTPTPLEFQQGGNAQGGDQRTYNNVLQALLELMKGGGKNIDVKSLLNAYGLGA